MNQANHHDSTTPRFALSDPRTLSLKPAICWKMQNGPPLKRRTVPKPSHLMEKVAMPAFKDITGLRFGRQDYSPPLSHG